VPAFSFPPDGTLPRGPRAVVLEGGRENLESPAALAHLLSRSWAFVAFGEAVVPPSPAGGGVVAPAADAVAEERAGLLVGEKKDFL